MIGISFTDYSWLISFIASGLVSNSVAEILGRKKSLMIDCLAFLAGFALYSVGQNAATLCVARAFLGYPLISMVSQIRLLHGDPSGRLKPPVDLVQTVMAADGPLLQLTIVQNPSQRTF